MIGAGQGLAFSPVETRESGAPDPGEADPVALTLYYDSEPLRQEWEPNAPGIAVWLLATVATAYVLHRALG